MAASLSGIFWNNPEFVRHRRAELRPVRAITVGGVVVVMCVLLGLACWSYEQHLFENAQRGLEAYGSDAERFEVLRQKISRDTWMLFYRWLVGLQGVALTFWTLFSCAQSVSGERDRKTWDFQRTTSLNATEILIGKLMGEPILVYFAVLCATPITLIAGLAGGFSFGTVLSILLSLTVISIFLGLGGMWLSTLLESRTRGVGLIGALALYGMTLGAHGMRDSGLPGLAAISPLTAFMDLLGHNPDTVWKWQAPVLFGHEVPWLLMTVLLCGSFSVWLTVMLVRNLKRDYPEIRPLSRWQAVGCAAFLNFLIYALLSPRPEQVDYPGGGWFPDARSVAAFAVAMNGLILFLMGLATLTPHERLKVWQRTRKAGAPGLFANDGPAWPWLGVSAAVAYGLMIWGLLAWDHTLPVNLSTLQEGAVRLVVVMVFVMRDVLFLQWCMLTRLRQPVVKGVLFLCMYYAAAAVTVTLAALGSPDGGKWALALLTPVQAFDPELRGLAFPAATYAGIVVQAAVIGAVLVAVSDRLRRPLQVGAAA